MRLTRGSALPWALAAIMSVALLAQAESPMHIILHHFFTHFVKEWSETHQGKKPVLTPEQRAAMEKVAATIDPNLPEAEQEKLERKLAHQAVVGTRFDPNRPLVVSAQTAEQRTALRGLVESLKGQPNESPAPAR